MDSIQRACRFLMAERGAHRLAAHSATQIVLAHESLNGKARNFDAFPAQLLLDLVRAVNPQVGLPYAFNVGNQGLVTLTACASQCRIATAGGMAPVG